MADERREWCSIQSADELANQGIVVANNNYVRVLTLSSIPNQINTDVIHDIINDVGCRSMFSVSFEPVDGSALLSAANQCLAQNNITQLDAKTPSEDPSESPKLSSTAPDLLDQVSGSGTWELSLNLVLSSRSKEELCSETEKIYELTNGKGVNLAIAQGTKTEILRMVRNTQLHNQLSPTYNMPAAAVAALTALQVTE